MLSGDTYKNPTSADLSRLGRPKFFFVVKLGGASYGLHQESGFLEMAFGLNDLEVVFADAQAGVKVEAKGPETRVVETDEKGRALFSQLKLGEYQVRILDPCGGDI